MGGRLLKIAIYGRSGAGKSYVAQQIASTYGYKICSSGAICRLLSLTLMGDESKKSLNIISTKMREIDEGIWIKAALRTLNIEDDFIFDSLRYKSDYLFFKQQGYRLLRVISDDQIIDSRLKDRGQEIEKEDKLHPSEWELESQTFDATIVNNREPLLVTKQIRDILEKWL